MAGMEAGFINFSSTATVVIGVQGVRARMGISARASAPK
jgi:hypothetical protein